MRARLALAYSGIQYEHREILLKDRPLELFKLSTKGTVPVFQLEDKIVIDESIDIMKWALTKKDPDNWYSDKKNEQDSLIEKNDGDFKKSLDQYKYHVRFKDGSYEDYQKAVGLILEEYENLLGDSPYLCGTEIRLVDMALFPFVRQCAHVDLNWFTDHFPQCSLWMETFKASNLFQRIMKKHDVWNPENNKLIIEN